MSLKGAAPLTKAEVDRYAPIFAEYGKKLKTKEQIQVQLGDEYPRFELYVAHVLKARKNHKEAIIASDEATRAHEEAVRSHNDVKQQLAATQQKFEQLSLQKSGLEEQLADIRAQRAQLKVNTVQYSAEIERSRQAAAIQMVPHAQVVKVSNKQ